MKKVICCFLISLCVLMVSFCFASNEPFYDPSYNNKGAFYANGNDIIIDTDNENNTVITWANGSQIVPSTVTVFGGGTDGTFYEKSNIVMNNGVVSNIAGGGVSVQENLPATVINSSITINGGEVLSSLIGGGYLYSNVDNSSIVINDGTITSICGGGMSSATVNGVYYSIGSEEDMQNLPNRTGNVSITINDGTIISPSLGAGLVYGGGQGYSYVGGTNLIINSGDMSNSYVTAGGSNGYTGTSNVEINGGNIMVYQSVNRGIVENSKTKVTGGVIHNFYIGGETGDPSVTGTINKTEVALLDGNINVLDAGKSNSEPIVIDENNYSVVKTDDIEITNNNLPIEVPEIEYQINVNPQNMNMNVGESKKLDVVVTTVPTDYNRFFNNIKYESSDTEIGTVSDDGTIIALKKGKATIKVSLLEEEKMVNLVVQSNEDLIGLLILAGIMIIIFIGIAMQTFWCNCNRRL